MTTKDPDPVRALPPEEKLELVRLMQQYLRDSFGLDPGDLGTELLLARAGELVGPLYWNKALEEAAIVFRDHTDGAAADLLANQMEVEGERAQG